VLLPLPTLSSHCRAFGTCLDLTASSLSFPTEGVTTTAAAETTTKPKAQKGRGFQKEAEEGAKGARGRCVHRSHFFIHAGRTHLSLPLVFPPSPLWLVSNTEAISTPTGMPRVCTALMSLVVLTSLSSPHAHLSMRGAPPQHKDKCRKGRPGAAKVRRRLGGVCHWCARRGDSPPSSPPSLASLAMPSAIQRL
jgi:hypothetical protein